MRVSVLSFGLVPSTVAELDQQLHRDCSYGKWNGPSHVRSRSGTARNVGEEAIHEHSCPLRVVSGGESADSWVCAIVLLLDVGVLLEVLVIPSGLSLCSSAGSITVYRDLNMENC